MNQSKTPSAGRLTKQIDMLSAMSLVDALWWFIENVGEDEPARTDLFFYLRERARRGE